MFADWWEHPVSVALREVVMERRRRLHELWEQGQYLNPQDASISHKNALAIGQLQEDLWLLQLDFETLIGELEDEREPEWLRAPRKGSPGQDDRGKPAPR